MNDTTQTAVSANLLEATFKGVLNIVARVLSDRSTGHSSSTTVIPCQAPEDLLSMLRDRAVHSDKETYALPAAGVSLLSVEPRSDGGGLNKTALTRVGHSLGLMEDGNAYLFFKGTPKQVTFQVTIVTDDLGTLLKLVDAWSTYTLWRFEIRLRETGKSVKVSLQPDVSLSVPPRSAATDGSKSYALTTNLIVNTYSGYLWKVPSVAKLQVESVVSNQSANTIEEAIASAGVAITRDILGNKSNEEIGSFVEIVL